MRRTKATPGWKPRSPSSRLTNPRPPAVPATLDLTIDEYYAAAGAIGLLAAQGEECDPEWAADWALEFGRTMAAKARTKRKGR